MIQLNQDTHSVATLRNIVSRKQAVGPDAFLASPTGNTFDEGVGV